MKLILEIAAGAVLAFLVATVGWYAIRVFVL
jgi:hypothetical protein